MATLSNLLVPVLVRTAWITRRLSGGVSRFTSPLRTSRSTTRVIPLWVKRLSSDRSFMETREPC